MGLGERIKRAREAAGLSLRAAAEKTDLSHTAISKFEKGIATPTSNSLIQLARAFGVRTEFFLRPTPAQLEQPEFRKRSTLGAKQLRRITADILDQVERFSELLDLFPKRPTAEFKVPTKVSREIAELDGIEDAAVAVRKAWNLGLNAIPRLAETLEEHGLLVLTTDVDESGKFDGLAATVGGVPVVVVNGAWPGDRQRFTMAHELGHLVLAGRLGTGIDEETACNRFAGAFLVPGSTVRTELGARRSRLEPRELEVLKHEYGLSMAAWVYRAFDQGVIDNATKEKLQRMFSVRGWRKVEPGEPVPPERPELFERLVLRALAEDMISTSKAAELMGESTSAFRRRLSFEFDRVPAHQ
jgi:Zn-dependent peptidase ImmA (M78 family)/DNA-binding XRE family transcriptional regulator